MTRFAIAAIAAILIAACAEHPPIAGSTAPSLPRLIQQIVTADYEADRRALDRLYREADAFLGDPAVESRVRYWKGFAKWRRAINGANETIAPNDLAADAEIAAGEMRRAGDLDPAFPDARIGEMQCLGLVLFFERTRAGNDPRMSRLWALMADLRKTAADNPRFVWAWGMAYFNVPPDKGGGAENVIPAYLKALEKTRGAAGAPTSPLDPTWGEAELNVNLAYSYLNQPSPDLVLAKKYVDEAVRLVPNWHYARDILRPQIDAAARKGAIYQK